MDEISDTKYLNEGVPPVSMPASEVGWEDMLRKLENDLPVANTAPFTEAKKRVVPASLLLLVFFVGVPFLIDTNHHDKTIGYIATNNGADSSQLYLTRSENGATVSKGRSNTDVVIYNPVLAAEKKIKVENSVASFLSKQKILILRGKISKTSLPLAAISQRRERKDGAGRTTSSANQVFDSTNVVNATGISKILSSAKHQPDSPILKRELDSTNIALSPPPVEGLLMRTGIQWTAPLPLSGASHYFSGADNPMQSYAIAIPGFWLTLTAARSSLGVELHPFASSTLSSGPYSTTQFNIDSTTTRTVAKSLHRVFGVTANVQYHYNLKTNWWIGGSMQGNYWKKGLVVTNTVDRKLNGASNTVIETKTKASYSLNAANLPSFSRFQLYTNADIVYRSAKWEAGLRAGFSATPLAHQQGLKNSVQTSLLFRYCLWQKE